ncbi:MAG TPA: DUF3570 domain-containing protein [Casimicrobiaceae bacterium]
MAATNRAASAGTLVAAALALPGVALPGSARAQTMPDTAFVQFKYLDYRDWQPGADRMSVRSPSFYALKPLSDSLVVEGSLVYDGMSGASPLYFNTLSGASGQGVHDSRAAGDVKLTRYFDGYSVGAGALYSHENDYISRAGTLELRTWTADRNRTWAFSFSGAADRIDAEEGAAQDERKYALDFLVGVTQAVNPTLIVQSNLTYSRAHGYLSDPYKLLDNRPDERRIFAWLTRANQFFPEVNGALRVGYRYLDDSWGADSQMVEASWVQGLPQGWSVTPGVRYLSQDAAWFYYGPPIGNGFRPGQPYTADNRLSAFGAITLGVVVAKTFDEGWVADLRVDFYRQKAAWKLGGGGTQGVLDFSARWLQVGVGRSF